MREHPMQPCVWWDAGETVGGGVRVRSLGVLGTSSLPVSGYHLAKQAQSCWVLLFFFKRNHRENF